MASIKEYAYYLDGDKVAIVQRDTVLDNDPTSKDYAPGNIWKSPSSTVADGLKVKYTYAKTFYSPNPITNGGISHWHGHSQFGDGKAYLSLADYSVTGAGAYTNFENAVTDGEYIEIKNAGKWNGIHRIKTTRNTVTMDNGDKPNNVIDTYTVLHDREGPATVTIREFEEIVYYGRAVIPLEDENFEIDLPIYLQKSVIYYIKAKMAEDMGEIQLREVFMKDFSKMIEKYENGRISGLRILSAGPNAIR